MIMNGARALLESLKQENVKIVFGYPGGVVLRLYDEVYKMKFPHILTGHEQGAVHAADGYARASGEVGVVFATSGPGAANLITGIATANMDSVPLVCITGQVANHAIGKDSFQEVDVSGITTPITKHNYLIKNVKDIPRVIKEAFFIARTGRPGPVVIDIAADVFNTEIDFSYPDTLHLPGYSGKYPANCDEIDEAVKLLEKSERPLIFFGGGVISSNTSEELREIVEYLNIPVTSTLMGIGGVNSNTEGYLGFAGMHGAFGANMAIQNSDLLLAIGMRFSDRVTGKVAEFAPNAKKIHFDIDLAEINKSVNCDLRVLGDLRESLPLFKEKIKASSVNFKEKFAGWKQSVIEKASEHPFGFVEENNAIKPGEVIKAVNDIMGKDTIVVTDVGQHQMWTAQFYKVENPREFLTSGGLGTMGFGLPAALGAKVAEPNKKVVLFTGDGSIMMNIQELVTAAENNIDVKVIIMHNGLLGMVGQWQRLFYEHHYSASELNYKRNFVKIAEAMGVKGERIENKADLKRLPEILNKQGAVVVDVIIPKEEDVLPMVPGGKRLDEMVLGRD